MSNVSGIGEGISEDHDGGVVLDLGQQARTAKHCKHEQAE
jgi:hypothetical protein